MNAPNVNDLKVRSLQYRSLQIIRMVLFIINRGTGYYETLHTSMTITEELQFYMLNCT